LTAPYDLSVLADLVPVVWENIEAVVFDIGGVFAIRHPDPVRNGMARAGFNLAIDDGSTYHDAHFHAVRALTEQLALGPVDEGSREFWINYERAYLRHLGIPAADVDRAAEAMFSEVFAKEPKPIWRYLLTDNITAFHRLGASGMPIAVVSNNDGTAAAQLHDFAIAQVGSGPWTSVAAIVDSGEIGIAKPDPAIFQPALEALGTDPALTLYVGDTVHADVLGATRAGMPVVQLDPLGLHVEFLHERATSVAEIVERLGR
jgi:putative hydrolase of the HAD superfamily